jgi:cytidine deaminase
MNLEVSMPTGTLCAERNAIGNALAADQTLCRRHLQAVAVLSLTLDRDGEIVGGPEESGAPEVALNPLDPCGACMEWLKKVGEVNPEFKIVNFADTSCDQVYIRTVGDYG